MKNCYNCDCFSREFYSKVPWCIKLKKETNALMPRCDNPDKYEDKDVSKDVPKDLQNDFLDMMV